MLCSRDYYNQTVVTVAKNTQGSWPVSGNTVGYSQPTAAQFLEWAKQQITAGRPVIIGLRMKGYTDSYYDHIVPFWGVCSSDVRPTAPLINETDAFSLTADLAVSAAVTLSYYNDDNILTVQFHVWTTLRVHKATSG